MFRIGALLAYLFVILGTFPASAQLALPVSPTCVTSPFGPRRALPFLPPLFHNGVDLRAPAGTWVHAVANGTVVAIRRRGLGGLQVEIRHSVALSTRYDHFGMIAPALSMGKRTVKQGDVLGRIGRTGMTFGPHLFFQVLLNGKAVDPAPFLGVKPCPP